MKRMRIRWRTMVMAANSAVWALYALDSYLSPSWYRFRPSVLLLLLGALGALALVAWRRSGAPQRVDWVLGGAAVAFAAASYPNTSMDFIRYLYDGQMIHLWHLSPYVHLPGEFPLDQYSQIFRGAYWMVLPSPYGPLWQFLMVLVNIVSHNTLVAGVIVLKLVGLVGLIVCARQVYGITRRPAMALLVVANPIVLLNSVATPHPDIWVAALLLAAYRYRGVVGKGGLIAAAALVKLLGLLYAPFFDRKRAWQTVAATGLSAGVLLLILRPLLGFDWVAMFKANLSGGVNGHVSLLATTLLPHAPDKLVYAVSYALFGLAYGALVVGWLRGRLTERVALALVSLVVPLTLDGLIEPWHFLVPLIWLVLVERRMAYWACVFLTLTATRSAVTAAEMLVLWAIFLGGGYVVAKAFQKISNPPKWVTRMILAFA
jgi:hypothetical protein